jgi:hypothetical protein
LKQASAYIKTAPILYPVYSNFYTINHDLLKPICEENAKNMTFTLKKEFGIVTVILAKLRKSSLSCKYTSPHPKIKIFFLLTYFWGYLVFHQLGLLHQAWSYLDKYSHHDYSKGKSTEAAAVWKRWRVWSLYCSGMKKSSPPLPQRRPKPSPQNEG